MFEKIKNWFFVNSKTIQFDNKIIEDIKVGSKWISNTDKGNPFVGTITILYVTDVKNGWVEHTFSPYFGAIKFSKSIKDLKEYYIEI